MPLEALTAKNLHQLDNGIAGKLIDHALAAALRDLDDRGDQDGKPREITIKLAMTKVRGNLVTEVQVVTKSPAYRSNLTFGELRQKGREVELLFRPDNAENPDQQTFGDMPHRDADDDAA